MTQVEIISGRICPYCGNKPQLLNSSTVYQSSDDYGKLWVCLDCQAWVGCHQGSDRPLGRLADKELRTWKMEAHNWFDPLWKKKVEQGMKKYEARNAAYQYLADAMAIDKKVCHIGMFDIEQCKQVVSICKQWYRINHHKNTITK